MKYDGMYKLSVLPFLIIIPIVILVIYIMKYVMIYSSIEFVLSTATITNHICLG